MLALALIIVLLYASQSATGKSPACKNIGRDDFTIKVDDVNNGRATAYLSMQNLSTMCPSLQYNVTVEDGRSSRPTKCIREKGRFACRNLKLNTDFILLVAIDNNGMRQQQKYTVSIGAEGQIKIKEEPDDGPNTSTPSTTVVWITIVTVLVCICAVLIISVFVLMKRRKRGTVSVKRISSLRAKAKARTESKEMHIRKTEDNYLEVGPPLPPRTLDMFIPVADDNSTSADSTSTGSTAVTVEDSDSATATLNHHQAFATTLDTVSISSDPPPIPPRTTDLLQDDMTDSDINFTSENTSSSHQLPSTVHHPMASNWLHAWQVSIHDPKSGLDTVSISSDPPPIPPRTADLLQDDTTDSDINLTSENTSSLHQLPSTVHHPMASNRLHAWQVSIHDPKSHKWFVFPRMLRVARVNVDCIPMHPNLSYETFAKNGCATY